MSDTLKKALCILRRKQVEQRTGLSRSTLYLKISRNEFPAPVSLGARAVGWLESEIDTWLVERIAASRNASV
jgi:prophage regulatory protein